MTKKQGSSRPRRRLGRTDLTVSALGLGGVGIGGAYGDVSEKDAVETVHSALEQGINFIDTSPLYKDSQRRLGLAPAGIPRQHYVLSTKTGTHPERRGDYSWDATLWSVENSLRLLKTDYADLLLVHDPPDMQPVFAPRGALEALEALDASRRFYRWCREKAIPMPAVVMQSCLRQSRIHCTLTGAKTPAELKQNLEGAALPLPENVWEELESLHRKSSGL